MKLGDNMTMEACNVWSDVTPRKYRPPRIGDIPKRGAIDEESPSYAKQPSTDARAGPSRVSSEESSDSGEIQEIRKDSALYLEEGEGPNVKKIVRSRPPGIFRKARRESSGYATSVGSLDEERKGSVSSTNDAQQQEQQQDSSQSQSQSPSQAQSQSLKEKRRLITRIPRAEESLGEKGSIGTSERMPTTEIHRKVSSAGLDMPDIEEVKEVLREETSPRSRDAETAGADHLSAQSRLPREAANQTLAVKSDVASSVVSSSASHDSLPKESLDTGSLKETLQRISCETNRRLDTSVVSPGDGETREASPVGSRRDTPCSVERATTEILDRKDQRLACTNDGAPPRSIEASKGERTSVLVTTSSSSSSTSTKTSVKVYQLLATQSEDRSDNEPHLPDRRISLQIAGSREAVASLTSNNTVIPGEFVRNKGYEGTPATGQAGPATKTSLPGEFGPQRYLGDAGNVRPIYPYYPYSPYGSPQGSPRNRRKPLRESRRVSIDNRQGDIKLNQYKLLDDIGQGTYGLVKLVYNEEDGTHYAMKILSKKRLMKKAGIFGRIVPGKKADPLARVYKEIALLKKVDHPNVVKLIEVLDDSEEDHLYLVFELQRGEILQIPTDEPLDEKTARRNFRDVVMGVEYLHYQRIVHRDIKPSNLLVDNDGRIKIADLGVSAELRAPGELLSGGAGTPAFASPETTIPSAQYSGPPCDVWSMGVTLYSLVTGKLPWNGSGSIGSVYAAARSENLKFPEKPIVSDDLRDLITRMLMKEPADRITLPQIKQHAWLTNRGAEPLPSETDNCRVPVTVTDEEVERVVTRVPKLDTLILIKTMLKQHSFQNPFLPKRMGRTAGNDTEAGPSGASSQKRDAKAEQFHRAGRSMSAPDSYDLHTSGRQVSVENPLPPVTEVSCQESEVEKR